MQSRPGRGYGPCVGCEPGLSVTGCVAGPARAPRAPMAGPARRRSESARLEPRARGSESAGYRDPRLAGGAVTVEPEVASEPESRGPGFAAATVIVTTRSPRVGGTEL